MEDACPDESTLLGYAEGSLEGDERDAVERHIEDCDACGSTLMLFAMVTASRPRRPFDRIEPQVSSRYTVKGRLGAGAQGSVWRVWDDELRRDVAFKFVDISDPGRRRQVRDEARTLALLQHPGVLEIYDVQLDTEPGYIAMHLCREGSLANHLQSPSHWREVVLRFAAVADALHAVHAAGVLHRDIKASNLLVADDGALLLADFGLAKSADLSRQDTAELDHTGDEDAACGTPVYLAPEVVAGSPHSGASDQYAFFVTLHQALCGASIPNPAGRLPRGVPRWLERCIRRGLHPEPSQRFRTMTEVASTLRRPAVRSWGRTASVLGVATVALGAGSLTSRPKPDAAPLSCEGRTPIAWTEADRSHLRRAVLDSGIPQADDAADHIVGRIDAYVQGWQVADAAACAPTSRTHTCLTRQRDRVGALVVAALESPVDAHVVRRMLALIPSYTEYEYCSALQGSGPEIEAPEVRQGLASDIHRAYVETTLGHAGDFEAALSALLGDARLSDYPDLEAEVLRRLASEEIRAGGGASAMERLDRAVAAAARGDDPIVEARVWMERANVLGLRDMDYSAVEKALSFAEAAVERGGSPRTERAGIAMIRASLAYPRTKLDEVLEHTAVCIELTEETRDWDVLARCEGLRSAAFSELERFDEALTLLERAKEHVAHVRAPEHVTYLEIDYRYASVLQEMGRTSEAANAFASLVERYEEHHPGTSNAGLMWASLGSVQLELGRHASAKESLERGIEIHRATGSEILVALSQRDLAAAELRLGNPDAAIGLLSHARTVLEAEVVDGDQGIEALLEEARTMKATQSESSSGSASKKSGGSSANEQPE